MTEGFGKRKLVRDISANTLQTAVTQLFALVLFYFISKFLSKSEFGDFNWSVALGSTIIAVFSLGLDLIYVKRISRGENILVISGIHFFHTVLVALVFGFGGWIAQYLFPTFSLHHPVFFLVFIYLAVANMANSFKLCLNGLEAYRQLAVLSIISNLTRFILIVFFYIKNEFNVHTVVISYITTSILEFTCAYFMMNKSLSARVIPVLKVNEYKYFIIESLPQLGVVLFDSALARIDWILLGLLGTGAATAEYSFAYRVFELSKFPLLVIAPVLLTRFSRIFKDGNTVVSVTQIEKLNVFFRFEMFLIMFIPIILCCCWSPVVDYLTDGKYGLVNETNFTILAFCVPLAALINLLWTLGFVKEQLKKIMYITIAVSIINIAANTLLIPYYNARGAAIAFLFSSTVQFVLYMIFVSRGSERINLRGSLISVGNGIVAVILAKSLFISFVFATVFAILLYLVLSIATRQFNVKQLKSVLRTGMEEEVNE